MQENSSEFSLENKVFCRFFMQKKWPPTVRKFHVFIAAISDLVCVCLCLGQAGQFSKCVWLLDDATSCGKIPCFCCSYFRLMCVQHDVTGVVWKFCIFRCGYFWLMCVYVCVYICMCCDAWHDRVVWKFHAFIAAISSLYMCLFALLFVWTRLGRLWGACQSELNLPVATRFATLMFGYS